MKNIVINKQPSYTHPVEITFHKVKPTYIQPRSAELWRKFEPGSTKTATRDPRNLFEIIIEIIKGLGYNKKSENILKGKMRRMANGGSECGATTV